MTGLFAINAMATIVVLYKGVFLPFYYLWLLRPLGSTVKALEAMDYAPLLTLALIATTSVIAGVFGGFRERRHNVMVVAIVAAVMSVLSSWCITEPAFERCWRNNRTQGALCPFR